MITPNCDMPDNHLIVLIDDPDAPQADVAKQVARFMYGSIERANDIRRILRGDLIQALRLIEECLPGWHYKVSRCNLSDDAWLFPGFYDPNHRRRFEKLVGKRPKGSVWGIGVDVEVRPPRDSLPAVALLCVAILAKSLMRYQRAMARWKKLGRKGKRPFPSFSPFESDERQELRTAIIAAHLVGLDE